MACHLALPTRPDILSGVLVCDHADGSQTVDLQIGPAHPARAA